MLFAFCHTPPSVMRQGLLLNLALAILAHVPGPQALRIRLSSPPALRLQECSARPGFYQSTVQQGPAPLNHLPSPQFLPLTLL